MYWRPMTLMLRALPSGGSLRSALAYSTPLCPARRSPLGPELGGFWIDESLAKVTTASPTRIAAAASVHPTSSRLFPRIRGGTAAFAAGNLDEPYPRGPLDQN